MHQSTLWLPSLSIGKCILLIVFLLYYIGNELHTLVWYRTCITNLDQTFIVRDSPFRVLYIYIYIYCFGSFHSFHLFIYPLVLFPLDLIRPMVKYEHKHDTSHNIDTITHDQIDRATQFESIRFESNWLMSLKRKRQFLFTHFFLHFFSYFLRFKLKNRKKLNEQSFDHSIWCHWNVTNNQQFSFNYLITILCLDWFLI